MGLCSSALRTGSVTSRRLVLRQLPATVVSRSIEWRTDSIGVAYASIAFVLHVASQIKTFSLIGCERAEADALHLASDFELDL